MSVEELKSEICSDQMRPFLASKDGFLYHFTHKSVQDVSSFFVFLFFSFFFVFCLLFFVFFLFFFFSFFFFFVSCFSFSFSFFLPALLLFNFGSIFFRRIKI